MMDDSLQSSHPIVVDVSSTAEITSVFDGISYSKVEYPPDVTLDAKKMGLGRGDKTQGSL